MPADISEALSRRLGISRERITSVCELLDAGLHPVFIAHYRKSATGGMDDVAIRRLVEARRELEFLADLRRKARRLAEQATSAGSGQAGALPPERVQLRTGTGPDFGSDALAPLARSLLRPDPYGQGTGLTAYGSVLDKAIDEAEDAETIEDLIRPFRPRRRTAGLVAMERGLGPLAEYAWSGPPAIRSLLRPDPYGPVGEGPDLAVKAAEFVSAAREVRSPEEALAGASHILADRVAEDGRVRRAVRALLWEKGVLRCHASKDGGKAAAEFRAYFQFREAINRLPPHRVLAINRGERSKAIKVTIEVPPEAVKEKVFPLVAPPAHRFREFLESVAADALGRLVLPAVDREVRRQLTDRAESHAIDVFVANLRSLLMTRPIRGKRVLAIQPGFRTGCKMAALDADGALLGETIIYPMEPQKKWDEGKAVLLSEIQRHGCELVAIGNGTGCREVEQLVSETIEQSGLDLQYAIVSEAGAAVYADSDLARQEFANLDAAIRATISIGRRIQDPLAELVKIDPRAIGVGLYQHDVNQGRLKAALEETMQSCVAAVGADAGTASPAMLRYIPGLGAAEVESLCVRRTESPLAGRDDLKGLPGWDDRTFQTAAGFLRVRGSSPLDATRVHPESYGAAERLLAHIGHTAADLESAESSLRSRSGCSRSSQPAGCFGGRRRVGGVGSAATVRQRLTGIALEPLAAELQIPLPDLVDLVGALQNPDHDPRRQHHGPVLRRKIRRIEDLAPGMWVKGTVRNVVDFGAFVDIGLKEDGLVHISQFSRRYVRNPLKFLHVGDVVDVRIVSIEADKHRIALTLIPEEPKKREPKPAATVGADAARAGGAPSGPTPASAAPPAARSRTPARPARTRAAPSRRGAGRPPPTAPGASPPGPTEKALPVRRPPGGQRRDAASGQPGRPRGPASDRQRRERRPPRSSGPRVIVSKSKPATPPRDPDEKGRPKIRWAYYESDVDEEMLEEVEATPAESASPQTPAEAPPAEAAPAETAEPSPPAEAAPAETAEPSPQADEPSATPPEREEGSPPFDPLRATPSMVEEPPPAAPDQPTGETS